MIMSLKKSSIKVVLSFINVKKKNIGIDKLIFKFIKFLIFIVIKGLF